MSKKNKKKNNSDVQPMELPSRDNSPESMSVTNNAPGGSKNRGSDPSITEVVTTETTE